MKYINVLLDFSMSTKNGNSSGESESKNEAEPELKHPRLSSLPLQGERIQIRAFKPVEDKPVLEKWLSDKFGRYFLLSRTSSKKLNIDRLIQNDYNIIGVITSHNQTPIGVMAFLDYDSIQGKAELRKLIGDPNMRGQGLGKEATKLWIRYGAAGLGLKKIYLNTLNTNIRNIKLNEELGFRVEGILRNETFFDGEYHDVLRMGLWNGKMA